MKRFIFPLLLLVFLLASWIPAQTGGDYDLSWNSYDGGGGFSLGGAFSLMGTIGQPDTAVVSGGAYSLYGGFWPGIPDIETQTKTTMWFLY